jgi:hypothetical protein
MEKVNQNQLFLTVKKLKAWKYQFIRLLEKNARGAGLLVNL